MIISASDTKGAIINTPLGTICSKCADIEININLLTNGTQFKI